METFLDFYENIPVPLQGMNADNYEIYVMYQDGFYDTQQTLQSIKQVILQSQNSKGIEPGFSCCS